jgi:hypothetical protein
MAGRVRQEKLLGSGCVTADMKKDAADAVRGMDHGLVDGAGLGGMFVGHLEGIVSQFVVTIGPNLLIAYVNPGSKTGKIHVDPIRVLRRRVEKAGILNHICIDRVLEAIRIARAVECLIFVPGEIDPEISAASGRVGTVAGGKT